MGFTSASFSPVGANARAGNAPQVFSYISQDDISDISVPGYFDEMTGAIRRGDWIQIIDDVDGTVGMTTRFVTGNGQSPAAEFGTAVSGDAGSDYVVEDLVSVTFTDGTVIQQPIWEVLSISSGAIDELALADPGLFDPQDLPTNLSGLAVTGGSGTAETLTITLVPEKGFFSKITFSPLVIVAV